MAMQDQAALRTLGLGGRMGVIAQASPEEIKMRYHELARRYHPDLHTGAAEKALAEAEFKKIGQAFARLQSQLGASIPMTTPVDRFHGVAWYHYTRYPPWSLSRGPPFIPSGVHLGIRCIPRSHEPLHCMAVTSRASICVGVAPSPVALCCRAGARLGPYSWCLQSRT